MITLHHLNFSRSSRVIWALEELNIPYKLVTYQRDEKLRAPPEMAKIHPLGKSPIIEDGPLVVAESAVILDYINERYGNGRLTPPRGTDKYVQHQEWLQFVEGSAAPPLLLNFFGKMMGGLPPLLEQYNAPNLISVFDYISKGVAAGPYLMGDQFTLADIQLGYTLHGMKMRGGLEDHSPLFDYVSRLEARPAFVKTIEVGGPMTFPKR